MVVAAFRAQLALVGVLVVLAVLSVVNVVVFARLAGGVAEDSLKASLFAAAVLSGWAAWLLAAALHLRRGGQVAYRLSLFGLVLPLVAVVAATLLGAGGAFGVTSGFAVAGTASDISRLLAWVMVSSTVGALATVAALALVTATTGMLMTGAARRFFATAT